MHLVEIARSVHATAVQNGWWQEAKPDIPALLCLVHSEVSEALEAWRNNEPDEVVQGKPIGLASELADIIIRVCDMSEGLGVDIEAAVLAKAAYNKQRPYRHGGKRI